MMRPVLVALLAISLVPLASAAPEAPEAPDVVDCLFGFYIPETFAYYGVWGCTGGQFLPEPVEYLTGCTIEFQLQLVCPMSAGSLDDLREDVDDLLYHLTGCRFDPPNPTVCDD